MPTIYEKLRSDIVAGMKSGDKGAVISLRTMDAAIQRASMDQSKPIDDNLVVAMLRKSIRNLTDAKAEFEKGARTDLVAANDTEIKLLEKYLPQGVPPEKLDAMIAEAIKETGAQSRKEMGRVIAALKQRPEAPLIDFSAVSKLVQAKLP